MNLIHKLLDEYYIEKEEFIDLLESTHNFLYHQESPCVQLNGREGEEFFAHILYYLVEPKQAVIFKDQSGFVSKEEIFELVRRLNANEVREHILDCAAYAIPKFALKERNLISLAKIIRANNGNPY